VYSSIPEQGGSYRPILGLMVRRGAPIPSLQFREINLLHGRETRPLSYADTGFAASASSLPVLKLRYREREDQYHVDYSNLSVYSHVYNFLLLFCFLKRRQDCKGFELERTFLALQGTVILLNRIPETFQQSLPSCLRYIYNTLLLAYSGY
jgi:hypothetical protein